jgi:hypothetical protein
MIRFTTVIARFGKQGEKTGWTYIEIPAALATQLVPGNKKSFRVKGKLDGHLFKGISLVPMGGGDFILTLNADIRKQIRKRKGDKLEVELEVDTDPLAPPEDFLDCLKDEPDAYAKFNSLTKGHQNYFINWVRSAKTEPTKAKRIARSVNALYRGIDFGQMLRDMKSEKDDFK